MAEVVDAIFEEPTGRGAMRAAAVKSAAKRRGKPSPKMKSPTTIYLYRHQHEAIGRLADALDTSMAELIRCAVDDYLRRHHVPLDED